MLEAATQAGAWLLRLSEDFAHSIISLKEAKNVKYADFVPPGQTLEVTVSIIKKDERLATFKVEGQVGERQRSAVDWCWNDTIWPIVILTNSSIDEQLNQYFRRVAEDSSANPASISPQ